MAKVKAHPNPRRYWRVDGPRADEVKLQISAFFDATNSEKQDFGLVNSDLDSLLVLYRRHPWQDWNRLSEARYTFNFGPPHLKQGSVILTDVPPGEYVLAERDYTLGQMELKPRAEVETLIFPNPSKRKIFSNTSGYLELFTLSGIPIFEVRVETEKAVDIQHLPAGLYLWRLRNNEGSSSFGKWIKE
jgi:hypothetical protein